MNGIYVSIVTQRTSNITIYHQGNKVTLNGKSIFRGVEIKWNTTEYNMSRMNSRIRTYNHILYKQH